MDYVIAEGLQVLPVEAKAGKTGTLKSLHVFVKEKDLPLAVRLNSDVPSLLTADTSLAGCTRTSFRLLSLPLYLAGHVRRLVGCAGMDTPR